MFKNCLSKFSCALIALCALVTGGLFQSCTDVLDDYKYDDKEPSWLGSSIYDFLNDESGDRTYRNYVRIIEDLDLKDVLARTGSKTLFIADDAAFEKFFANNDWGVECYEDLTVAQKKVILYNSMLDNAYLLDMLSSRQGDPPVEGSCLRRATSASSLDTVPFYTDDETTAVGFRLPQNNKFFDRYRAANDGKGMPIVSGASDPMMVHFLHEYLSTNSVLDSDFDIFFNRKKSRTGTEAFLYGNKILSSGIDYGSYTDDTLTITCKNGYIYRMDSVLVPPSDMAQELRENPNTQLFSRMLDRFAYPLYNSALTADYNRLYHYGDAENDERIYTMKYSVNDASTFVDDDDKEQSFNNIVLPFDPGYTQVAGSSVKEADMAAMLVPKDEMIFRFFAPISAQTDVNYADLTAQQKEVYGVGAAIVERYAKAEDFAAINVNDYMSIAPCLDSIPLDIVQAFLANLMKGSFVSSVPSKFDKVTNDARDPMGITPADVEECVLANNGVIYILNNVFGPAKYQAVMTPPLIMQNMRIMNKVINDLDYDSYLLAMDSYFSFIVPDDEYFVYYDPASLQSGEPQVWKFKYGRKKASDKTDGVWADRYAFDPVTYEILDSLGSEALATTLSESSAMGNRLHDLMEYLIIVDSIESGNQYYLTKGYGTVKCKVTSRDEQGVKFYGGEQIENGTEIAVKQRFPEKNGITYCTYSEDPAKSSGVVSPPTRSVYHYMENDAKGAGVFSSFYELCKGPEQWDSFLKSTFPNLTGTAYEKLSTDSLKKYSIFYKPQSGSEWPADYAVPFFSTYHYSVYVPTNEAIDAAYALGLPTWEQVEAELAEGNHGRVASALRLINKFVRYHFQDNAVYVDNMPFSVLSAGVKYDTVRYETAAIDDATGRFFETVIKTRPNPATGKATISVKDNMGNIAYVMNEDGKEGQTWNILSRDLLLKGKSAAAATGISTSSFAVIHQIDKALYNTGVIGYDGRFRRFATDGELVDEIEVGAEKTKYLIGYRNSMLFETAEGEVYQKTGYIMKKKPESEWTPMSREEYVFRADTAKILITEDGFLINEEGNFINWDGVALGLDTLGNVMFPDSIVTVGPDGQPIK